MMLCPLTCCNIPSEITLPMPLAACVQPTRLKHFRKTECENLLNAGWMRPPSEDFVRVAYCRPILWTRLVARGCMQEQTLDASLPNTANQDAVGRLPHLTDATMTSACEMAKCIVEPDASQTYWSGSHMTWLARECAKHLQREALLAEREAAAAKNNRYKYRPRPKPKPDPLS